MDVKKALLRGMVVVSFILGVWLLTATQAGTSHTDITVSETARLAIEGHVRQIHVEGQQFVVVTDDGKQLAGKTVPGERLLDTLRDAGVSDVDKLVPEQGTIRAD